jgi:hypothetical protein
MEMHNPSPYDSGYDSSFSTASGAGQPPSSRGNSNIEDQVDRYIRDQRVATIVIDVSVSSHNTHTDITRTIAQQHRTFMAIDNAGPPPTTPNCETATQPRTTTDNLHSQLYQLPDASNRDHLNPSRRMQYARPPSLRPPAAHGELITGYNPLRR